MLDPSFKLTILYNILRLISRHIRNDYVRTHYRDVEKRFKKMYKAYEEERWNDETQSLEHTPLQAFESLIKRTYLDYEDYAKEVTEVTN